MRSVERVLDNISSEVEEFHPLLKALFAEIPGIESVQYTHGPDEKGADFLLTRRDNLLKKDRYVGVIVKRGKITSDIRDIDRQVEECSLPRYGKDHKTKIMIEEIWVVANSTISNNAKDKIRQKYSARAIEFLDKSQLADLICEHAPHLSEDLDPSVSSYLHRTENFCRSELARSSLHPESAKPVYLHQPLIRNDSDYKNKGDSRKRDKEVNIHEEIWKQDAILIEGSIGSGKSTLLLNAALSFCDSEKHKESNVVPVYASFENLIENHDFDLVALIAQETGLDIGKSGKVFLVFVDSIDEVPLEYDKRADVAFPVK